MVVEKEVGGSEANDKSIRPGLSEITSNATLPVPQVVNTIPLPVVPHDAGALVFSPCNRICDQLNRTNCFVFG
jgi:hypothetical protein